MKVVIVSEPGVDGVFRCVEALVHFLLGQGMEVHLAYSDRRGSPQLLELVATVERAGGRTVNLRTGNRPALSDFRAFWALARLVRQVKPDIIHSHSSKAGALARVLPLAGAGWGAWQVYQPHAYAGMRPQRGRIDFVYDLIERILGHFSVTVSVSIDENNYALQQLRLPARRMLYVPNGISTAEFSPVSREAKQSLRDKLGLPRDGIILGSLGRAAAQKDPITLYRAFAKACQRRPNLYLFHVGRGELDLELDRLITVFGLEGRVIRYPSMATPVHFYRAVDGFILTSLYEGMSLAVLEALSCDLPLILSEAPGNLNVLELPLSHAWKAPIGDVSAFARMIEQWVVSCERPGKLHCNHREIAALNFERQGSLARVQQLYRDLKASRRSLPKLERLPASAH
ncbi:MAG: glycosyltransferase [Verrucomicrobia bacterium]|nr:glycosyltransferase [Verrucomicrobiota bacterium]